MGVGNLTNVFDLSQTGVRPDEAAFVAELRAGREDAFEWLIQQYHAQIYSLLLRSLRDPAHAADTTQEVFLKVFRGIRSFNGESSLRTWIYRIALHEASNGRRWWGRHKRCEVTLEQQATGFEAEASGNVPTLGEQLADCQATPYEAAAQSELRCRVEAALAQVGEPFRTAVILRDIEGFSYEEMAELLDVSLGTVKSRVVRGRAALREQIMANQQQQDQQASQRRIGAYA